MGAAEGRSNSLRVKDLMLEAGTVVQFRCSGVMRGKINGKGSGINLTHLARWCKFGVKKFRAR